MSSNEEYLDSLLKSVTAKEQAGNSEFNNELNRETENNTSEQGTISSDALEQILASEESMENSIGTQEEYADMEEKAFSDPGALFFSGEEDEERVEDSFLAIEDIPEDNEGDLSFDGLEEDSIAMADNMERDVIAAADNVEEDVIAAADSMEEDIIAMADSMEEVIIAAADSMEEDISAAADSTEEDIIAMADSVEEDVIAMADSMEEDIIAMADSVEEMPDDTALEDEGFKEINDLLASSSDGDDDMFAMLEGVGSEEESAGIDIGFFDEEENSEEPVGETQKGRKKREKKKKIKRNKRNKKQNTENEEGIETEESIESEEGVEELVSVGEVEKKPGIFKRFVDFLMEEEEEEEGTGKVRVPISEDDDLFVSEEMGENEAILQELSKEDESKKSGKADKKKKKKGKKGKNAEDNSEADEDELEEDGGKEKKKAKKEKKKKKEKVIEDIVPEKPGKKISIKKIEVTVVFCLTILAAILLAVKLVPSTLEKSKARDAYYEKDYVKVFEGFYNEELSDSDSIMYNRAYTILRLQRKIDGYNNYMRMGRETEALNQLIEGVIRYKEIYPDAEKYNVTAEVDELYQTITDALQNKYGISTTVAEGVYAMEDKLAYTLKLESIINGTEYVAPEYGEEETETQTAEE